MKRPKEYAIVGGLMFGAFVAGILVEELEHRVVDLHGGRQVREHSQGDESEYRLINPLLECEVADGTLDAYKENFRDDVVDLVDKLKRRGDVQTAAVYFRDLNNGPTFGYEDDEEFIPASLLKVPVMMAYYKIAEEDPAILDRELTLTESFQFGEGGKQIIAPEHEIEVGKSYTVRDLIDRTIRYSDNQAVSLLIVNLPGKPIRELYNMLGVRDNVLNGPGGTLTVKEYAAFFRIMFNASYLSRYHSEKALDLLSRTEFENGLKKGVPPFITVAHKFGEGGNAMEHQIHDCGIIYYPEHPYLMCVMTRGHEIAKLESAIGEISALAYRKIDGLYKK
jgi:beta-lactamase class A